MPKFQTIHARIKVDNKELPEYDVQVDEGEKLVSCWVPSEAGKCFSVCWTNTEPITDTSICGYVTLDGIKTGGIISHKGSKVDVNHDCCYTSSTSARKFAFSTISFTDDDAYLNAPVANLGEIQAVVWAVILSEKVEQEIRGGDPGATFNAKVHERSKKVGSHRVQFGDLEGAPRKKFYDVTTIKKLATFIFRYRPLGILQANGIAPLPSPVAPPQQNNKRKTSESSSQEKDSSEEDDEIDQQVKELQDKLKQLESRRAKKNKRVKIEKREHSPLLGVVIDLT